MASTLIHIKSRMLLPAGDDERDDEDEGVDPRDELVRRLLEYQRYKEAAQDLEQREVLTPRCVRALGRADRRSRAARFSRSLGVRAARRAEAGHRPAAQRHFPRSHPRKDHGAREDDAAARCLARTGRSAVRERFSPRSKSRMEVMVTFLAMLELVKVRAIRIVQEEMAGPIMIEAAAGMDEPRRASGASSRIRGRAAWNVRM